MPATPAWLAAIEALLNRGIDASSQAAALARRLNGTVVRVDVEGLTRVRGSVFGGRLALVAAGEIAEGGTAGAAGHADASIGGSPLALLRLARGGAARNSTGASAQVRGDAEIANLYRQLFAACAPDPEEELSRIVGDLAARRFSRLARQTMAWASAARRTAGENIAEYLQEESRDLVSKTEVEEFLHGVDALREAADRVEARLARLERRQPGSG